MLTQTEITAGSARLVNNVLTATDVDALTSVFNTMFAGLIEGKGYEFAAALAALDDSISSTGKQAAQVAAVITKLEELEFTGGALTGGRSGLTYTQMDEYKRLVLYAFSKIYAIPPEFGVFDLRRASWLRSRRVSQTIETVRVP